MDRYGYAVDWRALLHGKPISLASCLDCEALYHNHILESESLKRLYSEWIDESQIDTLTQAVDSASGPDAQFQNATDGVRHLLRLNRLLRKDNPEPNPPWRILDFGCGAGEFLKQANLFGFKTWGVDFSSTRANQALTHQVSLIASLDDFREQTSELLHAVTMFQVLEHLDDPRGTLLDLYATMLEGGVLIVEVPHCTHVGEPQTFEDFRNVHPLEHINAFTPETLTTIVESAGFEKINPGPAHVTDRPDALVRSELTRFYEPMRTNQYFRKVGSSAAPYR